MSLYIHTFHLLFRLSNMDYRDDSPLSYERSIAPFSPLEQTPLRQQNRTLHRFFPKWRNTTPSGPSLLSNKLTQRSKPLLWSALFILLITALTILYIQPSFLPSFNTRAFPWLIHTTEHGLLLSSLSRIDFEYLTSIMVSRRS